MVHAAFEVRAVPRLEFDLRAVLGNDTAIAAYREAKPTYPDGTIIARLAWSFDASEENNKTFRRRQSFVAGHPKNGVQFMVKDSTKYASTGGWNYAQFDDGKPLTDADDSERAAGFKELVLFRQRISSNLGKRTVFVQHLNVRVCSRPAESGVSPIDLLFSSARSRGGGVQG